jgi:hypothetical protein
MSDLAGDGKEIRIPLVTQLIGSGVGVGTLVGNEETLDSYGMPMWADWARNAVANNRAANKENSFSVQSTAQSLLRGWARRIVRDDIVDALLSIPTSQIQANRFTSPGNRVNGIKWSAATAANKELLGDGERRSRGVRLGDCELLDHLRNRSRERRFHQRQDDRGCRLADEERGAADRRLASNPGVYNGKPKITPFSIKGTNNDQEWYLCLLGSRAMRDLKADPTMYQANRDARERESGATKNNPIFTGGGLIYDGVIYLEIPEITQRLLLSGIGASSIDVEPVFLLGQSALGYVMGQMPRPTRRDETDYDFIKGIGIEAQYGVGKIAKAPLSVGSAATVGDLIDWGMVTGFVSGVANA